MNWKRWFQRRGGGDLPAEWARYRARRLTPAGEIRIMVWVGLLGGLLALQPLRWWPEPGAGSGPDIVAPSQGAEPASPAAVRVIDGDTIDYAGTRIRIADIDTPEVDGDCAYETALAQRATARMRQLIHAGPFELERTGTRDVDVYGRSLRIVTRAGRSLGQTMVAEGLARPWRGHREPWC